jgi:hypothetical protein
MGTNLKWKDRELTYQPFFDAVKRFETTAKAKGINSPFSYQGFESVLATGGLVNDYIEGLANNFRGGAGDKVKGDESLAEAFKSCVKHSLQLHSSPLAIYSDDTTGKEIGLEGYGATAIVGNHNEWSRLNPVITAGYLARSRSIEFYQIWHDDNPTFWRQYSVDYTMKGLNGEKYVLPKAIRAGQISGMLDLPLCVPKVSQDNPHISDLRVDDQGKVVTSGGKIIPGFISVGSTGNLMEEAGFDSAKHALEQRLEIDYVHVKFWDADTSEVINIIFRSRVERSLSTGDTSERTFNNIINVYYKDNTGKEKLKKVAVAAVFNMDTSDYRILSDGASTGLNAAGTGAGTDGAAGIVKHVHFKVRVTNAANEMETLMNGTKTMVLTFNVENKAYASIPIIPEMNADFNAGGENVSWVSYMTDKMTETYAGIRDLDSEEFLDEEYDIHPRDHELFDKLRGFRYSCSINIVPTKPGGSDDVINSARMSTKHKLTRIFTRCEKYINMDRNIQRQWIIMANDEDVDFLPDVAWQNSTSELTGNEGTSTFRFGFSLDDNYGWTDSFGRRVRVIGSRDERWLNRPITAAMKSLEIAAPTLIYFPYMFRVFSGISPEMRNRPALLFASRDTRRCPTLIQSRISLEGNDLSLYDNAAAFAAGYDAVGPGSSGYQENGVMDV